MYVFIFVSTFMINFSLYQAGPQNYANQGFEEKGPPFPVKIDETAPTNGNRNGYTGQSIYTRYFDGEKEVLNVGNGNYKKNVFFIGESPPDNSRTYSHTDSNARKMPNNVNQPPTIFYRNPQGESDLGNRFGSDVPQVLDKSLPRTHNTQNTREITRINNFGNGARNQNTFIISDLDGDDSTVIVYPSSDHNNNNKRRINIQKPDYHLNTNYDNTNGRRNFNEGPTETYNRFGRGPDNTNVVITNGKPIRTDFDPSVNKYDKPNTRRNFNEGPTETYNRFGRGHDNTNLVIINGKPLHTNFDANVNNYDNINTRRNFNDDANWEPTKTYVYNKIGNGIGNTNVFVTNDKPILSDTDPSVGYHDNINIRRYLNKESNFNNKATTDIYTYNRIGHGPYNKNVFINNDKSGHIVTIREREYGEKNSFNINDRNFKPQDKLCVIPISKI
ncbi:unnamed protein product [Euphydryas editha]|uniref:Uncharacterized protein n=1 Tax=Euphydryas editha TaxID=104508 RepID=A0AAU9TXZ2_EUPED|nr:unnamed protein product [Euphydryas editha]